MPEEAPPTSGRAVEGGVGTQLVHGVTGFVHGAEQGGSQVIGDRRGW